jgi:hypothetical protein
MPDSNAVRSRRKRLHAEGNHSECTSRCAARRLRLAPPPAAVPYAGDFDARAELERLAVRLHEAYRADPGNAALARETRVTLLALAADAPQEDPEMAEFFRSLSEPSYPS